MSKQRIVSHTSLDVEPEKSQMIEGVYLYKYKQATESGTVYQWVVENLRFNNLNIKFDFSGTENFDLNGPEIQLTKFQAYETRLVASIRQKDPQGAFRLAYTWNIGTSPPTKEALQEVCQDHDTNMQAMLEMMEQLQVTPDDKLSTVEQTLKSANTHFVDEDFPPLYRSIINSDYKAYGPYITWRRAPEFMEEGKFSIFEDGIDPIDIQQGQLGNCWFCCTLSAMAEHPALVERLFVTTNVSDVGMYRLRICKDGAYQEVTVDDYFPCFPMQKPIFTQNKGNELWVILAEKAYAKLHGSYHALKSGKAVDAMSDLTGYPVEYIDFNNDKIRDIIHNGEFWELLLSLATQDQMCAAGTFSKDDYEGKNIDPEADAGLVPGHAYSVLHAQEANGNKLIKMRNPWGKFEWRGDWSDSSSLWTEENRRSFRPTFDDQDGIFWMSYQDFLRYFDSLHVAYWHAGLRPNVMTPIPWTSVRASGFFNVLTEEKAAEQKKLRDKKEKKSPYYAYGFSENAYEFTISKKSNIFLTIYQQDERLPLSSPYVDIGIALVMKDGTFIADSKLSLDRRAQLSCTIDPGVYIAIPYSTGTYMRLQKRLEHRFNISLHTSDDMCDEFTQVPFDRQLLDQAICDACKVYGSKTDCGDGVYSYSYWSGPCMLYGIEVTEEAQKPYLVTLDCRKSANAVSHHQKLKKTLKLVPESFTIFHVLSPIDLTKSFTYSYSMSWKS